MTCYFLNYICRLCTKYIEQAKTQINERKYDIPEEDKSIVEKLIAIDERVAIMMAVEMLLAGVDTVRVCRIKLITYTV